MRGIRPGLENRNESESFDVMMQQSLELDDNNPYFNAVFHYN